MDLGSILIGVIMVLICIAPFMLMMISRKKKEQQMLQNLQSMVTQGQAELSEQEVCGNYAIGIDKTKNSLFFYQKTEEDSKQEKIELSQIDHCQLIHQKTSKKEVIEQLGLSFFPKDKKQTPIHWVFYDMNVNTHLNGELASVKKWHQIIYTCLK
ncbi:hypothetical protein [Mesonia sp. K7]|uniref:hypothetical protein n=1 Tax=Mesonia sp. K7 TaxID=2218606 RepID=UPI000DA95A69|nr:hypothetical protein [Mesonia sp. K7]PZD78524.1 hypothetical protein DNG35_05540 [Mesonia sp. K7]